MPSHRTLLLALVCVVAVSACGGGDDDATGTTSDLATAPSVESLDESPAVTTEASRPRSVGDVCALATDGEITAIVENQVVGVGINATLCEYSLVSGAPAVDGTAVDVFANAAFDDVCSLEFDVGGAGSATPIDGVGKIAKWNGGTQTAQLFVCTGSWFITITQYKPSSITDDEALVRATAIARILLDKL